MVIKRRFVSMTQKQNVRVSLEEFSITMNQQSKAGKVQNQTHVDIIF